MFHLQKIMNHAIHTRYTQEVYMFLLGLSLFTAPFDQKNSPISEEQQKFQNSLLGRFFRRISAQTIALTIIGIALHIFTIIAAWPFCGVFVGSCIALLLTKVTKYFNPELLLKIRCAVFDFDKNHPLLKLVILIAAVVVGAYFPLIGFAIGIGIGIYLQIPWLIQRRLMQIEINQTNHELPEPLFL